MLVARWRNHWWVVTNVGAAEVELTRMAGWLRKRAVTQVAPRREVVFYESRNEGTSLPVC